MAVVQKIYYNPNEQQLPVPVVTGNDLCFDFSGNYGKTITFTVENTQPLASTIDLSTFFTTQYSFDNVTWNDAVPGNTYSIDQTTGYYLYVRGKNLKDPVPFWPTIQELHPINIAGYRSFSFGCNSDEIIKITPRGHLMALYDYENPQSTTITIKYAFTDLFGAKRGNVLDVNLKHLILDATTLSEGCYSEMFAHLYNVSQTRRGLGKIRNIEYFDLPNATLAPYCYYGMFNRTDITTAPELPGTILSPACYMQMFTECLKLTTSPELPARYSEDSCYQEMFRGCKSLSEVKCNLVSFSGEDSVTDMLLAVSSTGTFYKNENAEWPTGVIPSGWTIQNLPSE